MSTPKHYDVIIIGAGAAGLMCAIRAGERGLSVLILEKTDAAGKKIRISGGGRCNFTNLHITPDAYISPNPHFCKSALSRYTQWHFIEWLNKQGLTYHEKTLGQLFCDQKSQAIIDALLSNAHQQGVNIEYNHAIQHISHEKQGYIIESTENSHCAKNLVIACGGPSIPKLGASDFANQIARQFSITNTPFAPALVPLTLPELLLKHCKPLAGVAHFVNIRCNGMTFAENILFTHRGLSGPAILQISSYWQKGDTLSINCCPHIDLAERLSQAKKATPQHSLSQFLATLMPNKLAQQLVDWYFDDQPLQHLSHQSINQIAAQLHDWQLQPSGHEGMKKAEVSTGGIHPDALSSKTFACQKHPNLHFIGEAVDVTGWLGGYNFQWAWSSGWCCGDSLTI